MLQSLSTSKTRCGPLVLSIQKAHGSSAAALAKPPKEAYGKWALPPSSPLNSPQQPHSLEGMKWARPPSQSLSDRLSSRSPRRDQDDQPRPYQTRHQNDQRNQQPRRPNDQRNPQFRHATDQHLQPTRYLSERRNPLPRRTNLSSDQGFSPSSSTRLQPPNTMPSRLRATDTHSYPARTFRKSEDLDAQAGRSQQAPRQNSRWRPETSQAEAPRGSNMVFEREEGDEPSRVVKEDKYRGKKGQSVLERAAQMADEAGHSFSARTQKSAQKKKQVKAMVDDSAAKNVYIPTAISVGNLARLLGVKREHLEMKIQDNDLGDATYDRVLQSDDACLLAMEFDRNPVVDEEAAFDLYPEPAHPNPSSLPLRPPVVTIMGHVDHGKTTLLDTLRSASVAASESGGITQHIGAFSVPLKSLSVATSTSADGPRTITFLDTPGHAAFSAMRARGAKATDIIVLVVAADDGVMPQTREVIELYKKDPSVHLVIAINKCDKPGIDTTKIKHTLLAEGVELEEFGGDIPAVEVSGLTGLGLDNLMETISTVAEVADFRAERDTRAHGVVLEAKMDKGRGPIATVLVLRGSLKRGDHLIAGTTWAKVRQMTDDKGAQVTSAPPGTPVIVAGWKELPTAGDEAICGSDKNGADEVKRAVQNRIRERDARALVDDIQSINEKRKTERDNRVEQRAVDEKTKGKTKGTESPYATKDNGIKELRLVVKSDVSGTVEAVVGAISGIGNKLARVNVVQSSVGDITESDVSFAQNINATILGFNIKKSPAIETLASRSNVPLHVDTVIYRIIDEVRTRVAALLPPIIEKRVIGEAVFQELFNIKMSKRQTMPVAGCRITNGSLSKHSSIRVMRNGEVLHEGTLDNLRHLKKDVTEVRKGMECGLNIGDYGEFQPGDIIQTFKVIETPAEL